MKKITTQAIFTNFRSKADRSIGFSGVTPEITPQEKALFFELQSINVKLEITPLDEPAEEYNINRDITRRTPSQRLRNVIFVYYRQLNVQDEFETFYSKVMEELIDSIKAKL